MPPIKIKICERDKNMNLRPKKRQVKVEQIDGTVVIKDENAVLKTDFILEYLVNDYIPPIKIRLEDFNIVYGAGALARFWFKHRIVHGVISAYTSFRTKTRQKAKTDRALHVYYGLPQCVYYTKIREISNMTLGEIGKYTISQITRRGALTFTSKILRSHSIFKVDGLKNRTKTKYELRAISKFFELISNKFAHKFTVTSAIETVYTDILNAIKNNIFIQDDTVKIKIYGKIDPASRTLKTLSESTLGDICSGNRNPDDTALTLSEINNTTIGEYENGTLEDIFFTTDPASLPEVLSTIYDLTHQGMINFIATADAVAITPDVLNPEKLIILQKIKDAISVFYNSFTDDSQILYHFATVDDALVKTYLTLNDIDDLTIEQLTTDTTIEDICVKWS